MKCKICGGEYAKKHVATQKPLCQRCKYKYNNLYSSLRNNKKEARQKYLLKEMEIYNDYYDYDKHIKVF